MDKAKKTKIINLVVNIVVAVILVFVFILTINILLSKDKGYVNLFGSASIAVETNSMATQDDSFYTENGYKYKGFDKGALITVSILKDEEKANLKVGDIITYYYDIDDDGVMELNTHRIIAVLEIGNKVTYRTRGDNNPLVMTELVNSDEVIGQYKGHKANGLGNVSLFFHTSTGFLVCVVVPAFLILVYCVYLLVKSILDKKKAEYKEQLAGAGALSEEEKAKLRDEERERIRQELLSAQKEKADETSEADKKDDNTDKD